MDDVNHQRIKTNGIWLHVVEKGTGPLVLLLHGFPDFCYSWRHQITFLADRGYHVVAPDLRGYGDSDAPISHTSYSILHIVGDIVGLIDHFGEQQAFVVGHDWGALAAWYLSIFRPDREPGRAEQAFARYDYLTVMKKFLLMEKPEDNLVAPKAMEIIDYLETPAVLPPWITEEELQVYADKFQESGFTGPLNYYRAMDLNWEVTAPWQGSKVTVPSKFIVGNEDIGFRTSGAKQYIEGDTFRRLVPDLEVVVLDGHHFIQQERAQEVSEEIAAFLHKHSSL
ncbi:Epoxide hydrolase A [Linum perenne]